MALTLMRRRRIAPMPRDEREFEPRPRRILDATNPNDDYLVEGREIIDQPSTGGRIVHSLQIVLIIVMAILVLAIVWLLGVVFNVF